MVINVGRRAARLFIPNFRVKMDAVPGRYTDLWFQATEDRHFPLSCAEYCGTSHSDMTRDVIVHPPGGYEKWLEKAMQKARRACRRVERGKLALHEAGLRRLPHRRRHDQDRPDLEGRVRQDEKR